MTDRVLLAVRSLFFLVLVPGTVAGYVPYRIPRASGELQLPALGIVPVCAMAVTLCGVGILLWCVWDFFAIGAGTLAPRDPPRRLVVQGLYRYSRNPMYNGVLLVLLGEAWLFTSASLLVYAAIVFVAFHLFVVLFEEPELEARFRESYLAYRQSVPRWGFTARPYDTNRHSPS